MAILIIIVVLYAFKTELFEAAWNSTPKVIPRNIDISKDYLSWHWIILHCTFFLSYTSFFIESADEAENSHNNVKIINMATNKSSGIRRWWFNYIYSVRLNPLMWSHVLMVNNQSKNQFKFDRGEEQKSDILF